MSGPSHSAGGPAALLAWLVLAFVGPCAAKPEVEREEVQRHGYLFEKWVRDTFFGGYEPAGYTELWDIPAAANLDHGGLPANPKAVKYGASIDLGDALRQFEIAHGRQRFLLIVGFWDQVTPTAKRFVNIQAVEVRPKRYRRLWGDLTWADLVRLDALIKDRSLSIKATRARVKELKAAAPYAGSIITLNPKIDASQRRLQCSLSFAEFFTFLAVGRSAGRENRPLLFGVPVPAAFASKPRTAARSR